MDGYSVHLPYADDLGAILCLLGMAPSVFSCCICLIALQTVLGIIAYTSSKAKLWHVPHLV